MSKIISYYREWDLVNWFLIKDYWYIKTKEIALFQCKHCNSFFKSKLWRIKYWEINSCWCGKKTHWLSKTRFYKIYRWIIKRCNNKLSLGYKRYGWRWIKCDCITFEDFNNDMYVSYIKHCEEYWEKQTSIDRINFDWNYCKENCKWATTEEQWNNKSTNNFITYNGETHTKTQWLKLLWMK